MTTDTAGRATFGADIGGTNVRVAVVDGDGTVVEQRRSSTPSTLDQLVEQIIDAVHELTPLRPRAHALGIGAAGLVDHDGAIRYAPNVPAFRDAPLRARVSAALGVPVAVDNDANVAALAELVHGAARGRDDVLLITLGTGVGGGIVAGGHVVRGAHGFGAEIGHFQVDPDGPMCACGQRGHWEAVASGTALGALGRARAVAGVAPSVVARAGGSADAVKGVHVGEAAVAGEPDALEIVAEYATQVAIGLVGLVNILDPDLVVVSGGLVELGDVLLAPLRTAFSGKIEGARYRPEVQIVPAALGEQAGVIGAAVLARDLIGASP
ncbi:MAG TPA: ROK family protein [Acidimicrobiia bacterium]